MDLFELGEYFTDNMSANDGLVGHASCRRCVLGAMNVWRTWCSTRAAQTRRLLDFCGAPFEAACLKFPRDRPRC